MRRKKNIFPEGGQLAGELLRNGHSRRAANSGRALVPCRRSGAAAGPSPPPSPAPCSAAKGSVARVVVSGALPSVAPRATVRSSPPAPRFRLPAHLGGAPARSPWPLLGKKTQHANFELF